MSEPDTTEPSLHTTTRVTDHRLRRRRGPSARYSHEREIIHSGSSVRDLVHLLVAEEYQSKQARKLLDTALHRLDAETRRADAADARALDTAQRFRALTDNMMAAQLEVSRVKEELGLYKVQLDTAQKEIFRAQEILVAVEAQRDDAEAAAAKARTTARQINEDHMIHSAREEGRRLGFEEGLRRGRRMGYEQGRDVGYTDGFSAPRNLAAAQPEGEDEGHFDELNQDRDSDPDMLPAPSPLYPESIRIRTPSITENAPQNASVRQRHSTTSSVPFAPATTNPVAARTPSVLSQSPTRTRPPSRPTIPPDGWSLHDRNSDISNPSPISVQANSHTVPGTHAQSHNQVTLGTRPRRRSSPESLSSTTTGLSQLDLISFPNPSLGFGRPASTGRGGSGSGSRGNVRGLSVIREDANSPARSVRSSANTNVHANAGGEPSMAPFTDLGRPIIPAVKALSGNLDGHSVRSQYSDPQLVEEWRHAESIEAPGRSSRANTPAVSMPPNTADSTVSRRTRSVASRSERSGDGGRVASSSGSITFDVVPPSRSSSHTNRPHSPQSISQSFSGSNHLLSPNSARISVPLPSGSQPHQLQPRYVEVPTVPNSPAQSQTQLRFLTTERQSTPTNGGGAILIPPFGRGNETPSGPPVIPGGVAFGNGGATQSRSQSRNQSRGSSREIYAVAPVPEGMTYPNPQAFRTGGGSGGVGMAPPSTQHQRSPSAGASAAQADAAQELHRVPSNASMSSSGSYSRFDRSTYLDPAYYVPAPGTSLGARAGAGERTRVGGGGRSPYAGVASLPA